MLNYYPSHKAVIDLNHLPGGLYMNYVEALPGIAASGTHIEAETPGLRT